MCASAGVQVVKQGEEEEGEDDTNGLWNGQPFRPLPTVTLPDLPAGCARAMSLKVLPSICFADSYCYTNSSHVHHA
jgi:hypothetical protein